MREKYRLPGQAWLRRWYQRCWHQNKDKFGSVLRRCHVHIPCWHQLRNSRVLVVLGIHSLASQMDDYPEPTRYILVQYRTRAFGLCIFKENFTMSLLWAFIFMVIYNSFIQYLSSISLITFPLLRYSSFCDLFQLASCCTYKFHKELICCLLNGRDLYT